MQWGDQINGQNSYMYVKLMASGITMFLVGYKKASKFACA